MKTGRLSPRARARLASLAGVVAACGLIAGSLVSLNRDVLPFSGWPTVQAQHGGETVVPAVPEPGPTASSEGRLASGTGGAVRLPDGRTVTIPLPGVIAGTPGGAAAVTTAPATTLRRARRARRPAPAPAPATGDTGTTERLGRRPRRPDAGLHPRRDDDARRRPPSSPPRRFRRPRCRRRR